MLNRLVLTMLKLTLSGPDEGVERVLGELVDVLLDKHHTKVEDSMIAYNDFINRLEADVEIHMKKTTFRGSKLMPGEVFY